MINYIFLCKTCSKSMNLRVMKEERLETSTLERKREDHTCPAEMAANGPGTKQTNGAGLIGPALMHNTKQ